MKITRVTWVEIGSNNSDSLTIKAVKSLAEAEFVICEKGIAKDVIQFIPGNIEIATFSHNMEATEMLLEKLASFYSKVVFLVLENDALKSEIAKTVKSGFEIIPCLKPFLSIAGSNKISITKRGTNTSFIVVREKLNESLLIKHLKFICATGSSIIIHNNFQLLNDVVNFLKRTGFYDLPIVIVSNWKGDRENWTTETIGTVDDSFSGELHDRECIIMIGESIRPLSKVDKRKILVSF